jgi:hypothetical protein
MRIRILQPGSAQLDGVDLSLFHPGQTYEVDPSVATYLIVAGIAEPSSSDAPGLVVRTDEIVVGVFAGAALTVSEVADDWEEDCDLTPPEPAA